MNNGVTGLLRRPPIWSGSTGTFGAAGRPVIHKSVQAAFAIKRTRTSHMLD
jgi:hypothetical protein